ncbi:MAG: DUF4982 domain-containing protein [Clostridia bacterium]|nr:DUF4982 domain-containing protein [Clostridia bacterium]
MREKILFDSDWYFHRGDLNTAYSSYKGIAYISAKTERYHVGPASKDYNISKKFNSDMEHKPELWESVQLPHDYLIGDIPDSGCNEARGFCHYENAWYIKHFRLDGADRDRRITLFFEGVANRATVYVNGCLMKHNFCGYTSFEVDITDVARFGETENVISVYVNTEEPEGWWYEGAGIYRHVWLCKTELTSVDLWGVYACPVYVGEGKWSVDTQVTLRNDSVKPKILKIKGEILDADGRVVTASEVGGRVSPKDTRTLSYKFSVTDPCLWSPERPYRYTVRTRVYSGERLADEVYDKIGFRTFYMDANKGLFINGKHYKIKGVCGHSSCGLTGKWIPDNLEKYKVSKIKEMGANGYRTSHYPQSEALMEALDESGFIVMDETRWFESTEEGKEQLAMLVKRDRNRPCVFFWCVGNEEPFHTSEAGKRIFSSLKAFVNKLDPSRPVMTAVTHDPKNATVFDDSEIISVNYKWNHYDALREKYPDKPFLASECAAAGSTRGWYFPSDATRGLLTAFDTDTNTQLMCREKTWRFIAERDWVMGGYQWISFDHRGEAVWPRLSSQSGAFDMYFQKKDAFYQNLSHWTDMRDKPMIHLLPHWNFRGLEGHRIRVVAYTNAPEAELFLNGRSLGRVFVERYGHGEWQVPYEAGELTAVAYNANGEMVAADKKITTGNGKRLVLVAETGKVSAGDVALVFCHVEDAEGREVPDACPYVSFSCSGAGKIIATGSGVTDHTSACLPERKMWQGSITVAVKILTDADSGCTVYAQADSLESAAVEIELESIR